jgi:hypothetical protein
VVQHAHRQNRGCGLIRHRKRRSIRDGNRGRHIREYARRNVHSEDGEVGALGADAAHVFAVAASHVEHNASLDWQVIQDDAWQVVARVLPAI